MIDNFINFIKLIIVIVLTIVQIFALIIDLFLHINLVCMILEMIIDKSFQDYEYGIAFLFISIGMGSCNSVLYFTLSIEKAMYNDLDNINNPLNNPIPIPRNNWINLRILNNFW